MHAGARGVLNDIRAFGICTAYRFGSLALELTVEAVHGLRTAISAEDVSRALKNLTIELR